MDPNQAWSNLWEKVQGALRKDDISEAEALLQQLVELSTQLPPGDNRLVLALETLAQLYFRLTKYGQAEPLVKRIIDLHKISLGPEHPDVGVYLNNLGLLFHLQKKHFLAESEYQKAISIQEKHLGPDHPQTLNAISNYARLLRETHRHQAAQKLEQKAKLKDKDLKESGVYQIYRPLSQIDTRETQIPGRYRRGSYNVMDNQDTLQNLQNVQVPATQALQEPDKSQVQVPMPSASPVRLPLSHAQAQAEAELDLKQAKQGEVLRRLLKEKQSD